MPRIPDASDLGSATPQASRQMQSYTPARVEGAGAALKQVGDLLMRKAEEDKDRVSKLELARAQNEFLKRKIDTDLEIESEQDYTKWGDI